MGLTIICNCLTYTIQQFLLFAAITKVLEDSVQTMLVVHLKCIQRTVMLEFHITNLDTVYQGDLRSTTS